MLSRLIVRPPTTVGGCYSYSIRKSTTIIILYSFQLLPSSNITHSIHTPVIIMGDFKSQSIVAANMPILKAESSQKSKILLLNYGSGTRIDNNGPLTPLDLTFLSFVLSAASVWTVIPDECGYDHFPIITAFFPSCLCRGLNNLYSTSELSLMFGQFYHFGL